MTYQYKVTIDGKSTDVTLLTDDPNEVGQAFVNIMGDTDAYLAIKSYLDNTYGAFGHVFDLEHTTAIDLDYALKQMPDATVESVADAIDSYDSGLKGDEIT